MKLLLIFIIVITITPLFVWSQNHTVRHHSYKQPPSVYLQRDSLIQFITPDKKYTYWEFDDGGMDTTKDGTVIYTYGVKPAGVTFKDPRGQC